MDFEQNIGRQTEDDQAELTSKSEMTASGASRAAILMPNADGVVVLPEGASLDDVTVRGRDLVVDVDGRIYVIPNGAVDVPVLVIDGVSVPPLNLAAYLTGNEPQPAAGTTQSSGGNFADPADPIQAAFGLGDLLPYTELAFPETVNDEILPFIDNEPEITFVPRVGEGTGSGADCGEGTACEEEARRRSYSPGLTRVWVSTMSKVARCGQIWPR
jgi:hypothetical protein